MDPGDRLRARWTTTGAEVRTQFASEAEVVALEQRYDLTLPADFRRYLLTGAPVGEEWDDANNSTWWPIDRIRNIPEEYDTAISDPRIAALADKYLFFADFLVWSWAWAICCADDEDRGRIAVIGGLPDRIVSDSFSEFVDRYLEDANSLL